MRHLAHFFGLCLLIAGPLAGQEFTGLYPLGETQLRLEFGVAVQPAPPFLRITEARLRDAPPGWRLTGLQLRGADLEAALQLPRTRRPFAHRVSGHWFATAPTVGAPGLEVAYLGQEATLRWPDAPEFGLYPRRTYALELTTELMGNVDCRAGRPRYTFGDNWALWTGAGLGLATTGAGWAQKERHEAVQAKYRRNWEQGYSEDTNVQQLGKDAEEARERANTYLAVGLVVAGVSSVALLARYWQLRNRQKTYDRYCGDPPGTAYRPNLRVEATGGAAGVGMCLRYNF